MVSVTSLYARYFARVTVSTAYVPQIDGLRFIAIMPVIFYHAALRGQRVYNSTLESGGRLARVDEWIPSGEIGVALFFFISGYIIAYPFLKDGGSTQVDLRKFYLRRLLRLWPEYALVMTLCFAAASLSGYRPIDAPRFNASHQSLFVSWLTSLGYLHGLIFDAPNRFNPPMWSLEIEVQFYLIAPLLLMAVRTAQSRMSIGRSIMLCSVLAIATEAAGGIFPDRIQRWSLVKYSYLFLLGICFSDFAIKSTPLKHASRLRYDLGLIFGLVIFLLVGSLHSWMVFHRDYPLALRLARDLGFILAIILIYFGALRGKAGRKVLALPWISVTGGMCYSIYLIHDPLMQGLSEVVKHALPHLSLAGSIIFCFFFMVPTVLLVGAIVFAVIERPFMNPLLLDSIYLSFVRLKYRVYNRT